MLLLGILLIIFVVELDIMQVILVIATLLKHAERLIFSELVAVVQRHVHTVTLSMSVQAVFLALLDRIHQLLQQLNQFLFVSLVLLVSIQLVHLQEEHLSLIVLFVLLVTLDLLLTLEHQVRLVVALVLQVLIHQVEQRYVHHLV